MKRALLISLVGLLILLCANTAAAYNDTAGLSAAELAAVEALSDLGVIEGYPDDSFRPHQPVSRAELAKIICVYAGQSELTEENTAFTDVVGGAWYYGWVNRAAKKGWAAGYPDGSYLPQESVTQQEAAAMLLRALDADTEGFAWPEDYIQAARETGMVAGFNFAGAAKASRLIICRMIYNLLDAQAETKEDTEEKSDEKSEEDTENTDAKELADGLYIGVVQTAAEREFMLWYPDKPLILSPGIRRLPQENTLIYYIIKDNVVESWSLLLNAAQGSISPSTALKRSVVKDGPYTWVATRTGNTVEAPVDLNAAKPLVRYHSYRNIAVGPNSLENRNYWLGDDCQIYEAREGQLSPGNRDSIELGQAVTLLVNNEDEVIVLLCWK